jgi:hypothetical protein
MIQLYGLKGNGVTWCVGNIRILPSLKDTQQSASFTLVFSVCIIRVHRELCSNLIDISQ